MSIMANGLNKEVKAILKDKILERLFKIYRSLPLPSETDKILSVLDANTVNELNNIVKDYYREFTESSVGVSLTNEDYMNIYLNRI